MDIKVKDGNKTRRYKLKPFDALTIADWRKVQTVEIFDKDKQRDNLIAIAKALTGIPMHSLRRLPFGELERLLDAVATVVMKAAETREAQAMPPTSFVLHGVTYIVPQSIERDTVWGQYEDLENVLVPKAETEADMYAAICAALCLPEGEQYDGGTVLERVKTFEDLPILTAMAMHAFFFESSERYRSAILRCIQSFQNSKQPKPEPTAQP